MLWGNLSLSNSSTSPAPSGNLTWIRDAATSSATNQFKLGFTNQSISVLGSPWSNSVPLAGTIPANSLLTIHRALSTLSYHHRQQDQLGRRVTNLVSSVNTNTGLLSVT